MLFILAIIYVGSSKFFFRINISLKSNGRAIICIKLHVARLLEYFAHDNFAIAIIVPYRTSNRVRLIASS